MWNIATSPFSWSSAIVEIHPTCYADGGCSLCSAESLSMLIGSYACEESWLSDKQLQS